MNYSSKRSSVNHHWQQPHRARGRCWMEVKAQAGRGSSEKRNPLITDAHKRRILYFDWIYTSHNLWRRWRITTSPELCHLGFGKWRLRGGHLIIRHIQGGLGGRRSSGRRLWCPAGRGLLLPLDWWHLRRRWGRRRIAGTAMWRERLASAICVVCVRARLPLGWGRRWRRRWLVGGGGRWLLLLLDG